MEIWYIRPNIFPCVVSRTIFLHLRRRKSCSLNVTCSALKAYARECRGRCFLRGRWSGSEFFLSTIELVRDAFDHVSGSRMPLFFRSPVQGLIRYTGVHLSFSLVLEQLREIGSRNGNIVLIDGPVTNSDECREINGRVMSFCWFMILSLCLKLLLNTLQYSIFNIQFSKN